MARELLGRHSYRPSATRPGTKSPPSPEREMIKETPKLIKERELCLNCPYPECPTPGCPVRQIGAARGRPKKIPPDEFLNWAWGPKTNQEWAKECGVDKSTVSRWRVRYADEIERRRQKKSP